MDSVEMTERYMTEYNKLITRYEAKEANQLIEDINTAIAKSDMELVNDCYNRLSEWNLNVAAIQGAGEALNNQFKHLKLPSVGEFFIVFDYINKEWHFNTEVHS